jgi:hypothetical protein
MCWNSPLHGKSAFHSSALQEICHRQYQFRLSVHPVRKANVELIGSEENFHNAHGVRVTGSELGRRYT